MADNITIFNKSGNQVLKNLAGGITLSENHTANNDVSGQTLENGSPLVDHIIINADEIEINLLFANMEGSGKPLEGEGAKTAWQELKRLRNNRELLEIVTLHEIYENMAIENLSGNHETPYKGQIKITIKLKKIDITNANIGGTNASKFTPTTNYDFSRKNAYNFKNISQSAMDAYNRGRKDPIKSPVAKQAVSKWYDKYITAGRTVYVKGQEGIQTATEYKNQATAVMVASANFIQVAKEFPSVVQAQVNDRLMAFTSEYNNLAGTWTLGLLDVASGEELSGLSLSPGLNILEGYLTDFSFSNLFVVELTDGSSSTIGAWGEGVQEDPSALPPPCVLMYFDDDALENLLNSFEVIKDLNFELSELDYTVVEAV